MTKEYEIPLVLTIRATDDSKAIRAAEYFIAAAHRFNGANLAFAETATADRGLGETHSAR